MADLYRYAAFVSYSSKDADFAKRLHRALESYSIPKSLGAFDIINGGKKNRIYPVFRDREELAAGHLGDAIEANLRASAALIVLCSPNAAASPWVQKEIEYFAGLGRRDKIFAIIAETAPHIDESGADVTQSCFPPAFRGDSLAGDKLQPLAADARKTKDGFRNAWLKIVAGLIGVSPGQLIDRDKARRRAHRRNMILAGVAAAFAALFIASSVDSVQWRARLAAYARVLASQDRQQPALAFALAATPDETSLLSSRSKEADAVIAELGAGGVALDLGPALTSVLSANQRFAVRLSESGETWQHLDLESGEVTDLGDLGEFRTGAWLSDTGATLLIRQSDDTFALYQIAEGAQRIDAPGLSSARGVSLTIDGARVAYIQENGRYTYADIRDGRAEAHEFGDAPDDLEGFVISKEGSVLMTFSADTLKVYDLRQAVPTTYEFSNFRGVMRAPDGNAIVMPINDRSDYYYENFVTGEHYSFNLGVPDSEVTENDISADGSAMIAFVGRSENVSLNYYDLSANGARTDLGDQGFVQYAALTPDGRNLFWFSSGGAASLFNVATQQIETLGNIGNPRIGETLLSDDGTTLVVRQSQDGRTDFYQWSPLADQNTLVTRNLGHFGRITGLSKNGLVLISQDPSSLNTLVHLLDELSDGAEQTDAAASRRQVCLGADGLRPFAAHLRAGATNNFLRTPSEQAIYDALAGRPWNPCDWRGLLSITPNASRGDGWFEGLGQWWRLIEVRFFGAPDWSCEETVSRAPEQQRLARRNYCDRESSRRDGVALESRDR